MRRGFTIVELVIVMTIMVILTGLGTLAVTKILPEMRDRERANDIAIIQRGLEEYYKQGNPLLINNTAKGTYPGTNAIVRLLHTGVAGPCSTSIFKSCPVDSNMIGTVLPGVTIGNVVPPNASSVTDNQMQTTWWQTTRADANANINTFLSDGKYAYHPYNDLNGGSCSDDCRAYELIYKKESTGEKVVVRSKHQ